MYPSTEELLSIRDGEPVDAAVRAAVDSDPALRAEVARLQATRKRLAELPEFEPPPDVRARVFAELRSDPKARGGMRPETSQPIQAGTVHAEHSAERSRGSSVAGFRFLRARRARWPLRGAIAAAVAVAAVLAVRSGDESTVSGPSTIVAEESGFTNGTAGMGLATVAYTSLTSESARLERLLNEIPYRPRMVNAGTATTITGLQDRIAQVDQILMYANVNGLQPDQTRVLWQERVDLMNALVNVRYAQVQRFGF